MKMSGMTRKRDPGLPEHLSFSTGNLFTIDLTIAW